MAGKAKGQPQRASEAAAERDDDRIAVTRGICYEIGLMGQASVGHIAEARLGLLHIGLLASSALMQDDTIGHEVIAITNVLADAHGRLVELINTMDARVCAD